jgi:hypothetical protein
MAETVTSLKVRFGADTKNFKADLESGKAAVDNFAGGAKDAFSEFASVFGVNMGEVSAKIEAFYKSFSYVGSAINGAIKAGQAKAANDILQAAATEAAIIARNAETAANIAATTAAEALTAAEAAEAAANAAGANATELHAAAAAALETAIAAEGAAIIATTTAIEAQTAAIAAATAAGTTYISIKEEEAITAKAAAAAAAENAAGVTASATAAKTAATGTGLLTSALKILRIAMISTGIGALVVALGSLISYFTKTERGAEAVERVMAGFKAVVNVLIDRFAILGEGIYKLFTGDFKGGWEAMKKSVQGVGTEIVNESKQAVQLRRDLQALEDREIALIEVQGKRRQSIEELRLKAKDLTLSEEERRKALAEAIQTQKAMTADEVALQKERVRIQEEQLNMGEKMDDDVRALAESRAKLNDLEAEGTAGIRSMMREYNSLSKSINEATQAERLAAIEREKNDSKNFKPLSPIKLTADQKTGNIAQTEIPAPKVGGFETDKLEASAAKIKSIYGDLQSNIADFSGAFKESMADLAVGFGESIGQMLAGTGGFSQIGDLIGSTLGEMAIRVGKIAIATGTAAIAIGESLRKAINTPAAGFAAIAAGVALIAVGTWAKSALGGAASGSYSSASSTSSYGAISGSGATTNIRSAPQTIYITGEFRQRGTDLVAVIDKNNQRRVIGT